MGHATANALISPIYGDCPVTTATPIPNVALPADDATAVGEWNLDDGNAILTVETAGDQWRDGCVDRYINVTGRLGTRRICHDFFSFRSCILNGPLESGP